MSVSFSGVRSFPGCVFKEALLLNRVYLAGSMFLLWRQKITWAPDGRGEDQVGSVIAPKEILLKWKWRSSLSLSLGHAPGVVHWAVRLVLFSSSVSAKVKSLPGHHLSCVLERFIFIFVSLSLFYSRANYVIIVVQRARDHSVGKEGNVPTLLQNTDLFLPSCHFQNFCWRLVRLLRLFS